MRENKRDREITESALRERVHLRGGERAREKGAVEGESERVGECEGERVRERGERGNVM